MKFDVTKLAALAGPRDGVVTFPELRAIGMSKAAIQRCCERGVLMRIAHGVYVFGPGVLTFRGRVRVAAVRGGTGSAGHNNASLAIHGIVPFEPKVIDVLTPNRRSDTGDIRFVRQLAIDPEDIVLDGFTPVTTVARAIVGLAASTSHDRITKLLREARYRHVLDLDAVIRCVDRTRCRAASATMTLALDRFTAGSNGSWSTNESLAWDVLHDVVDDELPLQNPRLMLEGNGVHPDLLWKGCGVLVEVDGFPHQFPDVQLDDADRERLYRRHDFTPVRLLPHDLLTRPGSVRDDVRNLILKQRRMRQVG